MLKENPSFSNDAVLEIANELDLRTFTSPDKKYVDRQSAEQNSKIIVSNEGERFLKQHPGLLRAIKLWHEFGNSDELLKFANIKELNHGAQSQVLKLECLSGESIILKRRWSPIDNEEPGRDLNQPYLNEMLQANIAAKELKDILVDLKIYFSDFFFATNELSCSRYVEGKQPEDTEENRERIDELQEVMNQFLIKKMQDPQQASLWKNVQYDLSSMGMPKEYKFDNFIETDDGTWIWIDPFFYKFIPPFKNNYFFPGNQ